MFTEEQAIEVARAEVLSPTFATTVDYLKIHTVVMQDDLPVVADVAVEQSTDAFAVYFSLQGAAYFLVVFVEVDANSLVVTWVSIQAAVRVYFVVRSDTLPPEAITERLGLTPTTTHRKGGIYPPRNRPYQVNIWEIEALPGVPSNVEEKLDALLQTLKPAQQQIAQLATECECWVWISYSGYSGAGTMGGWHLDAAIVRHLSALGVDVAVSLYGSGPELLP